MLCQPDCYFMRCETWKGLDISLASSPSIPFSLSLAFPSAYCVPPGRPPFQTHSPPSSSSSFCPSSSSFSSSCSSIWSSFALTSSSSSSSYSSSTVPHEIPLLFFVS
eukprot:GHVU01180884.1.p1 GENE.GHVU01180884.1~~GHVU01180884.1.p1  ORF type:complete len:107 (-),score=10.62 GHVU01180884.1:457-777(-)